MLIKEPQEIPGGEITPEENYLNRRNFMRAGIVAASVLATGYLYRRFNPPPRSNVGTTEFAPLENFSSDGSAAVSTPLLSNEKTNSFDEITNYNNFYEFSTDKQSVADAA